MEKIILLENEKIKIKILNKFTDRIKGFRFFLHKIDFGLCYPKKKMINTYFNCQKIDIVIANKNNTVLAIYKNIKSEKIIRPRLKAYYIYLLPQNKSNKIKIGEKLKIISYEKQ